MAGSRIRGQKERAFVVVIEVASAEDFRTTPDFSPILITLVVLATHIAFHGSRPVRVSGKGAKIQG